MCRHWSYLKQQLGAGVAGLEGAVDHVEGYGAEGVCFLRCCFPSSACACCNARQEGTGQKIRSAACGPTCQSKH